MRIGYAKGMSRMVYCTPARQRLRGLIRHARPPGLLEKVAPEIRMLSQLFDVGMPRGIGVKWGLEPRIL